jgi:hypothetical protein
MKNIFTAIMFLFFGTTESYGQEALTNKWQWQTRANFGVNIPLTKLLDGRVTDNLLEYADNSVYWQVLSISYFFHKNWAVDVNFQGMSASKISKRADVFSNSMTSEYENNYYVTPSTGATYSDFSLLGGNFERGFIGLMYRHERSRWFVYPKLAFGVSSFYTDWGDAILKQKNANNVVRVSYNADKRTNNSITWAGSAIFGYKLSKRFYLNFELMTSYYKTNISFIKKTTDLNTNAPSIENMDYKKNIFTLSLGGGLMYVIK